MPGLRTQWVLSSVWAKTKEQLQRDAINGINPITKKPVMQEMVEKRTKPLTADGKKTGEIVQTAGAGLPLAILRKSFRRCLWISEWPITEASRSIGGGSWQWAVDRSLFLAVI
jgi:hypothetical protein